MPIDSIRHNNVSNRYADKYQSIAPESSSPRGSWKSDPSGSKSENRYEPLINTKSRDLNAEKYLASAALNPRNPKAQLVKLNQPKDLDVLEKPTSLNKFILTRDGQMIVGNIDKSVPPKWVSHPALAEIGAGHGQSQNVISAGYIKKDFMGKTRLSHTSGHYLPQQSELRPAQQHLRDMGVTSTKGECVIV
ncbi:hypothetical protein [Pseudomonas lurida]|uniref:hypothetical protein n=1 Tax=Pseudomonas lurida TaxID=244566 RepID=UPI001F2B980A|nr:hypothetical protein [Pseudomonas lurida]MCF5023463.1 hypothetical protein [Pseudomonas lurida]MCF5309305.1 hypothetical protein [Pseudomonas lurida]MCF5326407.1 hypothetical protein [Pseudomonas lurida]